MYIGYFLIDHKFYEHVEIGKQSPLKQEWKWFLKSSSLFVRNYNYKSTAYFISLKATGLGCGLLRRSINVFFLISNLLYRVGTSTKYSLSFGNLL